MVTPPFLMKGETKEGGGNDCLTVNGPPSARHLGRSFHSEPGWVPEEYLQTLQRLLGNSNKGQQMKLKVSKQKKIMNLG